MARSPRGDRAPCCYAVRVLSESTPSPLRPGGRGHPSQRPRLGGAAAAASFTKERGGGGKNQFHGEVGRQGGRQRVERKGQEGEGGEGGSRGGSIFCSPDPGLFSAPLIYFQPHNPLVCFQLHGLGFIFSSVTPIASKGRNSRASMAHG